MLKVFLGVILAGCTTLAMLPAPRLGVTPRFGTTYADVVAGMRCHRNVMGDLECDYRVGQSLHFAIVAPGKPDGSIYFYSASFDGDYFAVVPLSGGCLVVRPGQKASSKIDLAFVSTRNGRVYRTLVDCSEGE